MSPSSSAPRSSTCGSRPPDANGAHILTELPAGPVENAVLITDDAERAAWTAGELKATAAFYLPRTPNGRGVSDAWSCASDGEPADGEPRLLVVSGDDAALDPGVRALAERADAVIGIGMFEDSFAGLADLVLPGTSYLEREGTTLNLEGRLQRQRRAVIGPCPDELAWIAKLAERFEVAVSPYASHVFDEVSGICYGGVTLSEIGDRATLPPPAEAPEPVSKPKERKAPAGKGLRLLTYRPLFSGPAVQRTPHLDFQRETHELELAPADARSRRIAAGDEVTVGSNGTSRTFRARIAADLAPGSVRVPLEAAAGLHDRVEVTK